MPDTNADGAGAPRLRQALLVGAIIWLLLLVTGFFAPGGWRWGQAGPLGHIENYMVTLWLVTLVLTPLLARYEPLRRTAAIQIYLLGLLGIVLSTIRAEPLMWLADGVPVGAVLVSAVLVIWAHPRRQALWSLMDKMGPPGDRG